MSLGGLPIMCHAHRIPALAQGRPGGGGCERSVWSQRQTPRSPPLARGEISIILAAGLVFVCGCGPRIDSPAGPLRVHPRNPRYFTDGSGKAIYLTGSHVWNNLQDWGTTDPPSPLDYNAYLDFLKKHNHDFTRGWVWEQAKSNPG